MRALASQGQKFQLGQGFGEELVHINLADFQCPFGGARIAQKIVDQAAHPPRRVDQKLQAPVRFGIQHALMAALDKAGKGRNLAQRLLQIVRGDGGKPVQLPVRALQLCGVTLEFPVLGELLGNINADAVKSRQACRPGRARPWPTI